MLFFSLASLWGPCLLDIAASVGGSLAFVGRIFCPSLGRVSVFWLCLFIIRLLSVYSFIRSPQSLYNWLWGYVIYGLFSLSFLCVSFLFLCSLKFSLIVFASLSAPCLSSFQVFVSASLVDLSPMFLKWVVISSTVDSNLRFSSSITFE